MNTLQDKIKAVAQDTRSNPSHVRIFNQEFGSTTTVDEVATNVVASIKQAVVDEITKDPENMGYAGKTPQEIADLINRPYQVTIASQEVKSARMAQLIRDVLENSVIGEDNFTVDAQGKVSGVKNVSIEKKIADAVAGEITNDPLNLGYKGKSKTEALDVMRQAQIITKTEQVTRQPRINIILSGIPFAPNALTAEEIADLTK